MKKLIQAYVVKIGKTAIAELSDGCGVPGKKRRNWYFALSSRALEEKVAHLSAYISRGLIIGCGPVWGQEV
jgi:hypothetical protein